MSQKKNSLSVSLTQALSYIPQTGPGICLEVGAFAAKVVRRDTPKIEVEVRAYHKSGTAQPSTAGGRFAKLGGASLRCLLSQLTKLLEMPYLAANSETTSHCSINSLRQMLAGF